MSTLLQASNISVKLNGTQILDKIDFSLNEGQHWAIVGDSGSGKTTFANVLIGRVFHSGEVLVKEDQSIQLVQQQHRFKTLSNTSNFYYQQRFQSQDSEDSLTIAQELADELLTEPDNTKHWLRVLQLENRLEEPLIQLSNGENKRLQLVKSLLHQPSILVLDNPFVGLDVKGRELLHRIINELASNGIHVIIITSQQDIPSCITHLMKLEEGKKVFEGPITAFQPATTAGSTNLISDEVLNSLPEPSYSSFDIAVKMVKVKVKYGEHIILENLNWEIKKGECWNLSGPNGAGKSTLLSLINADNPQAYANEIYLFDKRRGRGESIWDIKKNIGFVSPEMHLYFPFVSTCFEVVASGLFDTVGLFRAVDEEQEALTNKWLAIFQITDVANKQIQLCSLGQQRMALLARALIKNPPLLVLDEPCQGLDEKQTSQFNNLVDQVCRKFGTTLIYVSHYQAHLPGCVTKMFSV